MSTTSLIRKPETESPFRKSFAEKAQLKTAKKDFIKYQRHLDALYTKKNGGAKSLQTNDWKQMPQLLKMALAIDAAA